MTTLHSPTLPETGLGRALRVAPPLVRTSPAELTQRRIDEAVRQTVAGLLPMQALHLPAALEGLDEPPGTSDTSGDIHTILTSPGQVFFQAFLSQDPDRNPGGLPGSRWWMHTWVEKATFPVAPAPGRLYAQFSIDVTFQCLTPGAATRGVFAFVNLRSANFNETSWPIQVAQFTAVTDFARPDFTASIPVSSGEQVELDINCGMLLFAGDGEFESQGDFTIRRTAPASPDVGVLDYRFVPQWWIDDVARLRDLVTASR